MYILDRDREFFSFSTTPEQFTYYVDSAYFQVFLGSFVKNTLLVCNHLNSLKNYFLGLKDYFPLALFSFFCFYDATGKDFVTSGREYAGAWIRLKDFDAILYQG